MLCRLDSSSQFTHVSFYVWQMSMSATWPACASTPVGTQWAPLSATVLRVTSWQETDVHVKVWEQMFVQICRTVSELRASVAECEQIWK